MRNWKTTAAGIGSIMSGLGMFLSDYYDGSDATSPNYSVIVAMVITGIGLIFAKDAAKKSD